jgi:hypothetical protein
MTDVPWLRLDPRMLVVGPLKNLLQLLPFAVVVVLTGRYFTTSAFLGAVTYGPGGAEYRAANCSVSIAHTQIRCFTVPGTGRALFWVVTVGNQTSARSAVTTTAGAASGSPPKAFARRACGGRTKEAAASVEE